MKGAPPLFSKQSMRKSLIVLVIILTAGVPALQVFQTPARAADPTVSVTIYDYYFQPAKLNITTGTMVVWTYVRSGIDRHTVTSDPGTNLTQSGTALLNSGTLSPGQSFSYTFDQPGHYPYQCSYHPQTMNASVNVTGSPVSPPPATQNLPDYTLIGIAGGVVGVAIVAAIALFLMKRRRTFNATVSPQNPKS